MQEGNGNEIIFLRQIPFGIIPGIYAIMGALAYASFNYSGYWAIASALVGVFSFYAYHKVYKKLVAYYNLHVIKDLIDKLEKDGTFLTENGLIKYEGNDNDQVH